MTDGNENGAMKILWRILRIAIDFAIFWVIFLWDDSRVWRTLTSGMDGAGIGDWIGRIWSLIPMLGLQLWSMLWGFLGGVWSVVWGLLVGIWSLLCALFAGIGTWLSGADFGGGTSVPGILRNIWEHIVFLTPYGRTAAAVPEFQYCLHWCSGCVVLLAIFNIFLAKSEYYMDTFPALLCTLVISVALWYAGFGISFLLVRIPMLFTILAPAAMVVFCAVAGFVLLLAESTIWESI